MTLKSRQQVSALVFHSLVIPNGYNAIDAKRSKSNFVIKSLSGDDLLIARNGVELLNKVKGMSYHLNLR